MKKILFVINTMGRAGAETALIELLKKLVAMGKYEISLYAIIPRGELFARVPEGVRVLNRRVKAKSVLSASGRAAIVSKAARAFLYRATGFRMIPDFIRNVAAQKRSGRVQLDKVFWRLLAEGSPARREEYDLAVAYIEGASAYYLADRVRARRKAAFIHIDYQKAGYTKAMDRGCYDGVDRIFVVSREVGERFCAVYPEHRGKVKLFRNILDVDAIRRKAEAGEGFSDGYRGVRLLTVGRLTRQKGYDVAIESLARIRADGYDARWYVVGEGPERADLERRIERHGVQGEFMLLGAKENPYPYVKQADLYVHATRFEGKSIAVEEAQVLGKPIAASDCTGNAEQVASGYDGILFPLSAENIAKAVESLIDDPALRRALGARAAKKKLVFPEDTDNLLTLTEAEEMP